MLNDARAPITSLLVDDIHKRYQLQRSEMYLNKQFMDIFGRGDPKITKLIREWWDEYKSFTVNHSGMYHT
jgi:hypothetical protein